MASVLAAASYSRGGFSICLAGSARRVMVPGGSTFHLEPKTIAGMLKFAFHQIRDLVDVPCLPVLFDPFELLSRSKWWRSNINELNGGCWIASLKRVYLVGRFLGELF